jgi:hypothetical protein
MADFSFQGAIRRPTGIRYTENEVRERLIVLTMARSEPTLTETEITQLVEFSKREDQNRVPPSDTDNWLPTWLINGSVAMGWEMKAGKVAASVDVASGRQKISRSQMFTNFMAMADRWRRRSAQSIRLPSPMGRSITGINNGADELWDILWNFGYDTNDDRHGWAIPGRVQYVDDP